MNDEPILNGEIGKIRDETGRFVEGHAPLEGAGRPKKTDYQKAYEDLLFELVSKEDKPIIEALIIKAKAGDVSAVKEINDRILGRAKQPIELGSNPDLPLSLNINVRNKDD